jgi:hypothetical protein
MTTPTPQEKGQPMTDKIDLEALVGAYKDYKRRDRPKTLADKDVLMGFGFIDRNSQENYWSERVFRIVERAISAEERADKAEAEVERLMEALKRVGSSEALGLPFMPDYSNKEGKELKLRIEFARTALNGESNE